MTVPVHGLPPLLVSGLLVALVPPALKTRRWYTVSNVEDAGGPGQLVAFEGVTGIAEAEELVGKTILASCDDLPADILLHDADALLGHEVTDVVHGPLGTIDEVMLGSAQAVWVIKGDYGEVMLPAVEEFIVGMDEHGPIKVRLPEGSLPEEG